MSPIWLIPICLISVFVGVAIVAVCSAARDADYRGRIAELEEKLSEESSYTMRCHGGTLWVGDRAFEMGREFEITIESADN